MFFFIVYRMTKTNRSLSLDSQTSNIHAKSRGQGTGVRDGRKSMQAEMMGHRPSLGQAKLKPGLSKEHRELVSKLLKERDNLLRSGICNNDDSLIREIDDKLEKYFL